MRIIQKIFPRRCKVCRRPREEAKDYQVGILQTCDIGHCPFHSYISEAIKEAQKVELSHFYVAREELLEGETTLVRWRTKNCKSVSITDYGEVPTSGQIFFPVTSETEAIELNYVDLFDETFHYERKIKVHKKPTIEIIECKEKILIGEPFFIRYEAANAKSIFLKNEKGNIIQELSGTSSFTSYPLSTDAKFTLEARGEYGGEVSAEISIKVFEPPYVKFFKSDSSEKVDSLPIVFEFDYQNTIKAEIFCNNILLADVTGRKTFTQVAENKTQSISTPKFEFVVTGYTGATIKAALPKELFIYPQPIITKIEISPDNVILFPKQVILTSYSSFCEKILFSDGKNQKEISPNDSILLNPTTDTEYFLTPIGKQNFHGLQSRVFIEVVYPIEIEATADKKITLPNLPITLSWQSKNHSQILIEPGNIDVTNHNSCEIKLEEKTTLKIWGINKRDRKAVEIFIDVLPYPKFDQKVFGSLPKLDFQLSKVESIRSLFKDRELPKNLSAREYLSSTLEARKFLRPNLSAKIYRAFKGTLPRINFDFNRTMRNKMFSRLKSIKRS